MKAMFTPESELGNALSEFWEGLKDNSAIRAELRRCDSVEEVRMTAGFTRLFYKLNKLTDDALNENQMAMIIGLIAHLKFDSEQTVLGGKEPYIEAFVEQMTHKVSADRPLVSELRFRRLIQHQRADLYPAMIRVIRMMKGGANLYGLAESLYFWGDSIKKRWAYAYFPNVPAKKSA